MTVDKKTLWIQTRAHAINIELLCNDIKKLAAEDMKEDRWLPIARKFARIFVNAENIGIKLSEYITKNNLDPSWNPKKDAEVLSEPERQETTESSSTSDEHYERDT